MSDAVVAVLGTGMAGLGAGHILESEGIPFTCFDKNEVLGGHTRSLRYPGGFVFDEGGHISFTKYDHVKEILAKNVQGAFEERVLKIDNYWHGLRIPHPVQISLAGLPSDLIVRVITDFVEVSSQPIPDPSAQTYEQWLYSTYGKTFAETFPIVYGTKYHTTTMDNLVTDWIGPRMYRPNLEEVLSGALAKPIDHSTHYVDSYRYPSRGGFLSYLEPFADAFDIRLDHRVIGIDPSAQTLRFANGAEVVYSAVISSLPLPELIPLIKNAPVDVLEAAERLAFTTAVLFNVAIDREDLSETAITYFYDEDIAMSRVNLPHMFSPHNAPPGCGVIQGEIYFSDKYRPLTVAPETYFPQVIADLRRCGFIREDDNILLQETYVNRFANVIYDQDRAEAVAAIHGFLDDCGIEYCGRYGDWNHSWTDQSFVSGEEAARRVLGASASRITS
ncbi:protoporphyrinogen/coproporphyrinogen oxidase [Rathayibacter sp. CAU 1779]